MVHSEIPLDKMGLKSIAGFDTNPTFPEAMQLAVAGIRPLREIVNTAELTTAEAIHKENPVAVRQCISCGSREASPLLTSVDRFHGRSEAYHLVRCDSCSLVWLDNPPEPSEMGSHYTQDYDRTIAAAGDSPKRWTKHAKVIAKYKSGGSLLDLGCSEGGFLRVMSGPSWKLFGVEMSSEVAKRAEANTGAKVFVGDILDAPFPSASFDVITCSHVLEHVYDPQAVLRKVVDWLKPGGIFYVAIPNIDSAGAHIFGSYWYALELPRHLYHFSPRSLSKLASSGGLSVVSVTTNREVFLEKSVRYIFDDAFTRIGVDRTPLAKAKEPGIPFRILRKAFRLTALPLLEGMAALAGDGEIIEGIFMKSSTGSNESA
jgi:SAM-dependent methyltransferase